MNISELEFQRAGRNKDTQINNSYINSSAYRKKFDTISDSKALNKLIYKLAKKMLLHRSGTEYEDMYWIDLDSLVVVAGETVAVNKKQIIYSNKTIRIIEDYKRDSSKRLLTMHTHPSSFPPSIPDFNANFQNGYNVGLVICHDGKIFIYKSDEEISEIYYDLSVAKKMKQGYNEYDSSIMVLQEMQKEFDIRCKEVVADVNGK